MKSSTSSSGNSSSLQRAAAVGLVHVKGEFEACFAGGLDLSEFASSAQGTSESHAAALLQVKQAESATKLQQKLEEVRLQAAVHKRAEQLKAASSACDNILRAPPPSSPPWGRRQSSMELLNRTKGITDAGLISALVVGMHGAERNDEPRHKLSKKKRAKASPRLNTNDVKQKKKEKQAAKKSKRSKY